MGHLLPDIDVIPALLEWTAGKEVISSHSGETASPAFSQPLFIIDNKESEAGRVLPLKFDKALVWFLADPIRNAHGCGTSL